MTNKSVDSTPTKIRFSQAVALEGQWEHVWCLLLVDAVVWCEGVTYR
ncbi:hypothetical protein R3I94_011647 [Phoxinus phoxinus]